MLRMFGNNTDIDHDCLKQLRQFLGLPSVRLYRKISRKQKSVDNLLNCGITYRVLFKIMTHMQDTVYYCFFYSHVHAFLRMYLLV